MDNHHEHGKKVTMMNNPQPDKKGSETKSQWIRLL